MPDAYAICAIELPAQLGDILEPDHFRVVEVYLSRDAAFQAVNRLNIDQADSAFCYVVQKTNVVDNEPYEFVTIEPDYRLILVDSGDRRLEVIILLKQILGVSPVHARRLVDGNYAEVLTGSHFEVIRAQTRFDALGAVTRIEMF